MENIDIDMVILENIDIDIDKAILQNINIDKISNRFKFGISNRATQEPRERGENQETSNQMPEERAEEF